MYQLSPNQSTCAGLIIVLTREKKLIMSLSDHEGNIADVLKS